MQHGNDNPIFQTTAPLLLAVDDVAALTRLSRSKIYELAKCQSFPRPVIVPGTRSARWRRLDIEQWVETLTHVGASNESKS